MSYFDDQEDAWFEGGCVGDISDVDPYEVDDSVVVLDARPLNKPHNLLPQTRSQKSRARKRARQRRRDLQSMAVTVPQSGRE